MDTTSCDVLVVGGGINGAGIARDLAGRGWRVVLCEQGDLAAHTSSASTKLIHGGLRYLEQYEFALVRKALREREVLLRSAPHLIRPLRFVMPHDAAMRPAWMISIGLMLYDRLARRDVLAASERISLAGSTLGAPLQPRLQRAFVYSDGWVDDARLVVAVALDARERGAQVHTRTRCERVERGVGGWTAALRQADGRPSSVLARALVNATGPWAESFLRHVAQPGAGQPLARRTLRLVKGSHVVVPRLFDHDHAYLLQNPDKRIIFAIPYEDRFTLVGTTDMEYVGDPAAAKIDADEIEYLCAQVNRYFRQSIDARAVRWSYSGVRPLLDDGALAAEVSRDYELEMRTDGAPLLSVWGGKMTTFRKLAEEAAGEVGRMLGQERRPWTADARLPGADFDAWIGPPSPRPDRDFERFVQALERRAPQVRPALLRRLARAYGSRAGRLLERGLGAEIAPGLHEGELRHLCEDEWARSAEDVLWRRSKLGLHFDEAAHTQVAAWFGQPQPRRIEEASCS